ncbi:MAG: septum formation protein Maf [Clostridia bacterium]|nr:septum formation protein Maf [Clostridia bacterium]
MSIRLILASESPRRRELLSGLGLPFEILPAHADEHCDLSDPTAYAEELARRKGRAVADTLTSAQGETVVVVSADTVVATDREILGKPRDRDDAIRMISELSGTTHRVITGIALTVNGVTHSSYEVTEVTVDPIPREEIERYVDTGDPMDKAGAYGIQGDFSRWVRGIKGCYFNVVGLPMNALNRLWFECMGAYPS